VLKMNLRSQLGFWTKPHISIYTRWTSSWWGMCGVLVELVVPMTIKLAQVEKIKRKSKSPLLDQWTFSPKTLQRTKVLCTHSLRWWCCTNCMNSICLQMHITHFPMRGSMIWVAKSMTFFFYWLHSRLETILRTTECVVL